MRILACLLLAAAVLPSAAVEVQRVQDAYWVSGGVSADERDEMIMALPDHNLKVLTAAEKSGAFLAGAQVVVRDAGGRPSSRRRSTVRGCSRGFRRAATS